jgi:hypothetical protein
MNARGFVVIVMLGIFTPALATARPGFVPLPPLSGQTTRLQLRVVRYTGGVHGKMVVEVKNPSAERASFSAQGLYFVPELPVEAAPQREGAAGPFEVASLPRAPRASETPVAAGATVRLHLATFCLDSHRASPTGRERFRVARTRLPAALSARIESGAAGLIRTHAGNADAASGEIQNLVWQTRNRSWIVLEGERTGERSAGPASQPAPQDDLTNL